MRTEFAEVAEDGHLAFPEETCQKLRLTAGTRFQVLTEDADVLVLKRVDDKRASVMPDALLLQQVSLERIWDDPGEDIYDARI